MKKYINLLIVLSMLYSCTDTDERILNNYTVRFNNSSTETLIIEGYNSENVIVYENNLLSNQNSSDCTGQSEVFSGIICKVDSIVFKFNNNKGYICDRRGNNNLLCFLNDKNPMVGQETYFNNLGNNTYEFVITQDDFDNAFDLP